MLYLVLKSLHVVSVVVFLGNIVTGMFWKSHADRVGTLPAREQAIDGIIRSDRWFTTPGVFAIIATGVWLAIEGNIPILGTKWVLWSIILFGVSGVAFGVAVAPLQKKLLANVRAGAGGAWNESGYRALSRAWMIAGLVATLAPLGAVFLMVMKPA